MKIIEHVYYSKLVFMQYETGNGFYLVDHNNMISPYGTGYSFYGVVFNTASFPYHIAFMQAVGTDQVIRDLCIHVPKYANEPWLLPPVGVYPVFIVNTYKPTTIPASLDDCVVSSLGEWANYHQGLLADMRQQQLQHAQIQQQQFAVAQSLPAQSFPLSNIIASTKLVTDTLQAADFNQLQDPSKTLLPTTEATTIASASPTIVSTAKTADKVKTTPESVTKAQAISAFNTAIEFFNISDPKPSLEEIKKLLTKYISFADELIEQLKESSVPFEVCLSCITSSSLTGLFEEQTTKIYAALFTNLFAASNAQRLAEEVNPNARIWGEILNSTNIVYYTADIPELNQSLSKFCLEQAKQAAQQRSEVNDLSNVAAAIEPTMPDVKETQVLFSTKVVTSKPAQKSKANINLDKFLNNEATKAQQAQTGNSSLFAKWATKLKSNTEITASELLAITQELEKIKKDKDKTKLPNILQQKNSAQQTLLMLVLSKPQTGVRFEQLVNFLIENSGAEICAIDQDDEKSVLHIWATRDFDNDKSKEQNLKIFAKLYAKYVEKLPLEIKANFIENANLDYGPVIDFMKDSQSNTFMHVLLRNPNNILIAKHVLSIMNKNIRVVAGKIDLIHDISTPLLIAKNDDGNIYTRVERILLDNIHTLSAVDAVTLLSLLADGFTQVAGAIETIGAEVVSVGKFSLKQFGDDFGDFFELCDQNEHRNIILSLLLSVKPGNAAHNKIINTKIDLIMQQRKTIRGKLTYPETHSIFMMDDLCCVLLYAQDEPLKASQLLANCLELKSFNGLEAMLQKLVLIIKRHLSAGIHVHYEADPKIQNVFNLLNMVIENKDVRTPQAHWNNFTIEVMYNYMYAMTDQGCDATCSLVEKLAQKCDLEFTDSCGNNLLHNLLIKFNLLFKKFENPDVDEDYLQTARTRLYIVLLKLFSQIEDPEKIASAVMAQNSENKLPCEYISTEISQSFSKFTEDYLLTREYQATEQKQPGLLTLKNF